METNINGTKCKKLYIRKNADDKFVLYKKAYARKSDEEDWTLIYSAGNPVTYVVDTGVEYTEEVDSGATCLSPVTFTPTKDGYAFVGWRQDTTASAEVETDLVMGDEPMTLYSVFSKDVTLTYAGNGATSGSVAAETKQIYYNNGNVVNPTFTLAANGFTRTSYTFIGWDLGAVGATVEYTEDATCTAQWRPSTITSQVSAAVYKGTTLSYGQYSYGWYGTAYDLTNVSKITITLRSYYNDYNQNPDSDGDYTEKYYYNTYVARACVSANKSTLAKYSDYAYGNYSYTPSQTVTPTLTLDVSSLTGYYYIGTGVTGYNSYASSVLMNYNDQDYASTITQVTFS